jgi:hypothetical protein
MSTQPGVALLLRPEGDWCAMKEALYGELYLWNRNMDRLKRVLQRMEGAALWSKKDRKAYEVRLEEIRAGLNADFAEAMAKSERDEQERLRRQRTAWETKKLSGEEEPWKH